jgi:small-conductance mechanosensitive channel
MNTEVLQDFLTRLVLFVPKLVVSLVVFGITLVVAGSLSRIVRRAMEQRDASAELTLLMSKITRWTVIILGSLVALQQVDFDIAAFLAGLGILGFTIGFALQDVSKNFVAGLLLLLQQPFDIGDTIAVGEFLGTVVTVDLRVTELRTADGRNVLIPNADVLTSPIVKYGRTSRCIELVAGVSYDSDLALVCSKTLLLTWCLTTLAPQPLIFQSTTGLILNKSAF